MFFQDICSFVGMPEKDAGSGIHIFLYTLDDGSTVRIGFASLSKVAYVLLSKTDGTEEWLAQSK